MSQFFTSGGQSIGVSASTSVLPMNTQDRSPLGWTGWISLLSKGFSRVFSNTTVQKHQFSMLSFLYSPTITPIPMGKTIALTRRTFFGKVMSLLFNMLSQFSSVAQLCLTLCSSMNCSTPGLPVHHQLLESTQTHVH